MRSHLSYIYAVVIYMSFFMIKNNNIYDTHIYMRQFLTYSNIYVIAYISYHIYDLNHIYTYIYDSVLSNIIHT